MSLPPTIFNVDLSDWPKPLAKLIETVAKGLGIVYEPTHMRRKASAEADALRIRGEAEAEYLRLMAETEDDLLTSRIKKALELQKEYFESTEELVAWRATQRIRNREIRRQNNLEAIVGQAAQQLPETVADEPVDDDWIALFFNYAENVSNEQLQSVWARLLSGEVTRPGSFSPLLLQTVRNLRPSDAVAFEAVCRCLWNDRWALFTDAVRDAWRDKGIADKAFENLRILGVIVFVILGQDSLFPDGPSAIVRFGDEEYKFTHSGPEIEQRNLPQLGIIRAIKLTSLGQELATLCTEELSESYRKLLLDTLPDSITVERQSR